MSPQTRTSPQTHAARGWAVGCTVHTGALTATFLPAISVYTVGWTELGTSRTHAQRRGRTHGRAPSPSASPRDQDRGAVCPVKDCPGSSLQGLGKAVSTVRTPLHARRRQGSWRGSRGVRPAACSHQGPGLRTPLGTRNGLRKRFAGLSADAGAAETRKSPVPARPRPGPRRSTRGPVALHGRAQGRWGSRTSELALILGCLHVSVPRVHMALRDPTRWEHLSQRAGSRREASCRAERAAGSRGPPGGFGLILFQLPDLVVRRGPVGSAGSVRAQGPGPPRSRGCSGPLRGGPAPGGRLPALVVRLADLQARALGTV